MFKGPEEIKLQHRFSFFSFYFQSGSRQGFHGFSVSDIFEIPGVTGQL